MKRIKVVLISRFSNPQVRERLPLSKTKVMKFMAKVAGVTIIDVDRDALPWTTAIINELSQRDEIELHVIAPQRGLKRLSYEFEMNGVNYHFIRTDLPFGITQVSEKLLPQWQRYRILRWQIKRLLKSIKPDIVNQIGCENPNVAYHMLDRKDCPMYLTVCTIADNPLRSKYAVVPRWRGELERRILNSTIYFGISNKMWRDLVVAKNPQAVVLKFAFPLLFPKVSDSPKEFDFVCFSVMLKNTKGYTDAIEALELIIDEYPQVRLNIVGDPIYEKEQVERYKQRIKERGMEGNVLFTEPFSKHEDLMVHIQKSHFALLPVKMDAISGTTLESMMCGLPVVTYRTTGTPLLNADKQTVLIAEMENISDLANNMRRLLGSEKLADELRQNGFEYVRKQVNNEAAMSLMIREFGEVIENYRNNTPISQELLFETQEKINGE